MTGEEDSRYRLRIARVLLAKAEQALARADWREAALFARSAIENGAKAVLASLSSVPRSHEPAELLECSLSFAEFPAALRGEASELSERVRPYGMAHHVLLSYGDEANHVDPWALVSAAQATQCAATAAETVDFASRLVSSLFPGP